jgi:cell division transport system permease protein
VLTSISNGLSIASAVVVIIFLIVSVVIITNTIRITVNSRRQEINIMKYVGATDWFIRWPFIIEGVLIGLFGSAIPLALSLTGYNQVLLIAYEEIPMLQNIVSFIPAADIFRVLIPMCLAFGVAIGITGSSASIRKHLQV